MKHKKAPKWKFILAKMFGKKQVTFDAGVIIISYFFCGATYITEIYFIDSR